MNTNSSFRFYFALLTLILPFLCQNGLAGTSKMFDVPQDILPEWGKNWCAPTAVGNSFAWLAKEYPELSRLMKDSTGKARSAVDVIDDLGKNYMNTSPKYGTTPEDIKKGKEEYIKAHGLSNKINFETAISPTKRWVKQQRDKGADVEIGVGYYKYEDGKWKRIGGHAIRYGSLPGSDVGGNVLSLSDVFDPYDNDDDTNFYISFTDPGRDDLTGQYGAIGHEQYWLTDAAGIDWFCTSSTYEMIWEPDIFGDSTGGGYLLNGYQGEGDFGAGNSIFRTKRTLLESAWVESPVPEPASLFLLIAGSIILRYRR